MVRGQLNAPATFLPGKETLVPTGWESQEPVWMLRKREKSLAPFGNQRVDNQPITLPL
jgi:hypothetical protein